MRLSRAFVHAPGPPPPVPKPVSRPRRTGRPDRRAVPQGSSAPLAACVCGLAVAARFGRCAGPSVRGHAPASLPGATTGPWPPRSARARCGRASSRLGSRASRVAFCLARAARLPSRLPRPALPRCLLLSHVPRSQRFFWGQPLAASASPLRAASPPASSSRRVPRGVPGLWGPLPPWRRPGSASRGLLGPPPARRPPERATRRVAGAPASRVAAAHLPCAVACVGPAGVERGSRWAAWGARARGPARVRAGARRRVVVDGGPCLPPRGVPQSVRGAFHRHSPGVVALRPGCWCVPLPRAVGALCAALPRAPFPSCCAGVGAWGAVFGASLPGRTPPVVSLAEGVREGMPWSRVDDWGRWVRAYIGFRMAGGRVRPAVSSTRFARRARWRWLVWGCRPKTLWLGLRGLVWPLLRACGAAAWAYRWPGWRRGSHTGGRLVRAAVHGATIGSGGVGPEVGATGLQR